MKTKVFKKNSLGNISYIFVNILGKFSSIFSTSTLKYLDSFIIKVTNNSPSSILNNPGQRSSLRQSNKTRSLFISFLVPFEAEQNVRVTFHLSCATTNRFWTWL